MSGREVVSGRVDVFKRCLSLDSLDPDTSGAGFVSGRVGWWLCPHRYLSRDASRREFVFGCVRAECVSGQLGPGYVLWVLSLGGVCLRTGVSLDGSLSPDGSLSLCRVYSLAVENGFQTLFCFHLHRYSMQNHFDETV